jgi:hypothetical protein
VLSPGHSGGCQLHAWPVGANFGAGREAARPGRPSLVVAAAAKAQERKSCYAAAATAAANAAYLVPPPPQLPLGTVGRGSSIRRRCCSSGPTAGTGDHADATAAEAVLVATVGVSDAPDNDVKRKVSSSTQGEHMPA